MVGNHKTLDKVARLCQENGLVLKVIDRLQNYLSCEVRFSQDKKKAWQGQPYMFEGWKKLPIKSWELKS